MSEWYLPRLKHRLIIISSGDPMLWEHQPARAFLMWFTCQAIAMSLLPAESSDAALKVSRMSRTYASMPGRGLRASHSQAYSLHASGCVFEVLCYFIDSESWEWKETENRTEWDTKSWRWTRRVFMGAKSISVWTDSIWSTFRGQ